MIRAIIFDWGDTVMRDIPGKDGPMADWEVVECIPGVEEALIGISEKYFCAIATNAGVSDTALMKKALERVGLAKHFQFFTSSKDLHSEKPDPLFFVKIASILGVKPEECIHVGNIYEKDIIGARACGMHTIFFNEKGISGDFRDAERMIVHMSQLTEAIESIRSSVRYILEICCDSLQSAVLAAQNGASRIELCAGLGEGGVTPSIGTIVAVLNSVNIPVNVLIRPRPGNFCYSDAEVRSMIRDIEFCKKAGVQGIVCGALTPEGDIDEANSRRLLEAMEWMDSTYHRAFDCVNNAELALEQIIRMGYRRILTSGQMMSANAGLQNIANYVELAKSRISIMPGAGINEGNIIDIAKATKANEFHMSLRAPSNEAFTLESKSVNTSLMHLSGDRVRKVRDLLDQLP
jgi:copper homeostasis protein